MNASSQVDSHNRDLVRRKIQFEDEIETSVQILSTSDDDHQNMKLKRLFKSRAKKLIERAESLTRYQFNNLIEDYGIEHNREEEKEIKILGKEALDRKIMDVKKLQPQKSNDSYDFSIDLPDQNSITAGLISNKNAPIEESKESKEDRKGDLNDEEFKKSREEKNKL